MSQTYKLTLDKTKNCHTATVNGHIVTVNGKPWYSTPGADLATATKEFAKWLEQQRPLQNNQSD